LIIRQQHLELIKGDVIILCKLHVRLREETMSLKIHFSIRDLENLSGVKAHTIRIWEKRYGLLSPQRSDTNIRKYNLDSFKKLLDVTFIYNHGVKISKIAAFTPEETKEVILKHALIHSEHYAIDGLKKAMINFDTNSFNTIFSTLLKTKTFEEVFETVFIPLLQQIGVLWHIGTIDVSHERFMSELIKRKTIEHIELRASKTSKYSNNTKVCLFLPYDEIHDIGLIYANFILEKSGIKTIYLGPNIPLESLTKQFYKEGELIFLTFFTIKPDTDNIKSYLDSYQNIVCKDKKYPLWILGPKYIEVQKANTSSNIESFENIKIFLEKVKTLVA
jgi:DNA-binding transcriptional MerR regulator